MTVQTSRDELYEWYHGPRKLCMQEVAERLGCSRAYVSRLFAKHDIPVRDKRDSRHNALKRRRVPGHAYRGSEARRREAAKAAAKERAKLPKNRRKAYESIKRHRKAHPNRTRCRYLFSKAVKQGRLVRPDYCKVCGEPCKPEGHHWDYTEPFLVTWACKACHEKIHHASDELPDELPVDGWVQWGG